MDDRSPYIIRGKENKQPSYLTILLLSPCPNNKGRSLVMNYVSDTQVRLSEQVDSVLE